VRLACGEFSLLDSLISLTSSRLTGVGARWDMGGGGGCAFILLLSLSFLPAAASGGEDASLADGDFLFTAEPGG
jgi:hypothetical protein